MRFNLEEPQTHESFVALLKQIRNEGPQGVEIKIANRLWGQSGYDYLPKLLQVTHDYYGAELSQVDFIEQTEKSRQTINHWVAEETDGKINELLQMGVLNNLTRLVLTNAIYFKGNWADQFDQKLTKNAPFHISMDEDTEVPMSFDMHMLKT